MSQADSAGTMVLASPVQSQVQTQLSTQYQNHVSQLPQVQVVVTSGIPDASQIQALPSLVAQSQATTIQLQVPNTIIQTSPGNKVGKGRVHLY